MPRIFPATAQTPQVEAIFQKIKGAFGRLPGLFKTYAHHPPLLLANWNKVKTVMMEGTLSRKVEEMTGLVKPTKALCLPHPFSLTLGDVGDAATHTAVLQDCLRYAAEPLPE